MTNMGRPLKKLHFGDPASSGRQLDQIDSWIPGESAEEKCWVVSHPGTHKFVVHSNTT